MSQAGQLQLQGTGNCFALGSTPATSFKLDTTQATPVLSVNFQGGANNKFVLVFPSKHIKIVSVSFYLCSRRRMIDLLISFHCGRHYDHLHAQANHPCAGLLPQCLLTRRHQRVRVRLPGRLRLLSTGFIPLLMMASCNADVLLQVILGLSAGTSGRIFGLRRRRCRRHFHVRARGSYSNRCIHIVLANFASFFALL